MSEQHETSLDPRIGSSVAENSITCANPSLSSEAENGLKPWSKSLWVIAATRVRTPSTHGPWPDNRATFNGDRRDEREACDGQFR